MKIRAWQTVTPARRSKKRFDGKNNRGRRETHYLPDDDEPI